MTKSLKAQRVSGDEGRRYVDAVTIYRKQRFGIGRCSFIQRQGNKDKVNRYKGCVKRKGKQEHSKGDKPPTNRQSHVAR